MSSLQSPEEKTEEKTSVDSQPTESDDKTTYQWTPQKKHEKGVFMAQGIPTQNIEHNDYSQSGCLRLLSLSRMPQDTQSGFVGESKSEETQTTETEKASTQPSAKGAKKHKVSSILVLYNPISGKGASKRIISNVIVPLIKSYGHTVSCWESTATLSMIEYLISNQDKINKEMNIDTFIVVGGDGTFKFKPFH
ncbi:hypothetical protein RFI_12194 [Reticulomyxa filosa]|uniref:DAGKc domain-containing protein n=1 Tax=Reticulomyxa filosa TaxID=46433 RepID=X6NGW4_RETFI|nr:hypothetical protein RFI_12194 [Reticulomyxa filosa]|eukprot:ETO24949.1 hypothetical protein RFI_12194 [Reticulomyxa filosa]